MIKIEEIYKMFETVKNEYIDDAKDLSEALDLVSLALDGLYDSYTKTIQDLMVKRNVNKAKELMDMPEKILVIQEKVDESSLLLIDEKIVEEDITVASASEDDDKKEIPNYDEYTVDTGMPHSIDEDFTHKRPCGFSFNDNYYDVNNMREILLQMCAILAEMDLEKIYSFVDDPTMKGRKVSYFSETQVIENGTPRNEKIQGTDIYVWVNLSCNSIRNILRKIFKKYGLNRDGFKIYLRADYSSLHKKDTKNKVKTPLPEGVDKIGKLVNKSMRKLSDSNYKFSNNEIIVMQSAQWSKDTIGIYEPLIKKYDETKDIASQVTINSYPRFWKEIFEFNGENYFVTSQWYERHRETFLKWYNSLEI